MTDLRKAIQAAINSNSAENGSNTPDFVLGIYLESCLAAFDAAVIQREAWYGRGENLTATTPNERGTDYVWPRYYAHI